MSTKEFIEYLRKHLPLAFTRKTICALLGKSFSPGGLANMTCYGKGPEGVKIGKTIVYQREVFLEWLQKKIEDGNK